ncbi:TPA: hypothetical protein EYP66_03385 [Candidatus Poribacteria bacterium]|nr:hypothetical protein [Candidatus Poribacteria bacterium]
MDRFVRNVAIVTLGLLALIFINTYIGAKLGNELGGVDDVVETIAVEGHDKEPRPVLELPGDTEVGAFTIASLGVGLIIGYTWRKIFSEKGEHEEL